MRSVLYADDMEPITVIDLPPMAEKYLGERGVVRLAVPMPPMLAAFTDQMPNFDADIRVVAIFSERFIRKGREHMMLFTQDEESSLLLKCGFLPGQRAGLQERERAAFARGFMDAFARLRNE